MSKKLQPCPFCGGKPAWSPYASEGNLKDPKGQARWWIDCLRCKLSMGPRTRAEAVYAWNARARLSRAQLVAGWREMIEEKRRLPRKQAIKGLAQIAEDLIRPIKHPMIPDAWPPSNHNT